MKCNLAQLSLLLAMALASCNRQEATVPIHVVDWDARSASPAGLDSLHTGSTYLSVYSEIYQVTEGRTYHLTVTVSMRNISSTDSVYVFSAKYYNTKGHLIRTYFEKPIYISPLETVEIVISEGDKEGGTGGNFIFEWGSPTLENEPHFEAVMISTTGQQGLSFTTQGIKR
ncbi:MAG: DUF3124 domain-containing protein [Cyclobacteriaceae bacterium]|nr:DUF3124 domain-containing protein [Cyclobacteriaceae bacterium]MCB9239323.1 DUF3124 domain-containing protein [Flammeovirgaceae bacterium]MCB0500075.1 DUF3124 domain-containing protein [Cyclobacteriaceae bacterium]MCO5271363.1 DUF3124 domain-containing protein [Cyclobacteriaceae bacterium]MCW5903687.1 DUF3124 domain-containing protein [Cyclobacteriaceae bacterium]